MAIVIGVALAASVVGIANDFVNDDIHLIANNARLQDLSHWREWFTLPFWPPPFSPDLYRPLTSMALALEYVAGGGSPATFRIASYLLYAAAAAAVFLLAKRLMPRPFALAAAVGLMLPGFLLAAELSLVRGESARARVAKIGRGFALLAGVGVGLVLIRAGVLGGQLRPPVIAEALRGLSLGRRLLTMLQVVPEWLRLLVWPVHLRIDYGFSEILPSSGFGPRELFGLVIVALAIAAAWLARKRAPAVTFGILWTAISLLPVSNLVLPTAIVLAERTLLLPSIGVLVTLGGAVEWLLSRRWSVAQLERWPAIALLALIVTGALTRTIARERAWRDSQTLLFTSVRDNARSWRVWQGYGDVLFGLGRNAEAVQAYDRAIELSLDTWPVRNNYGTHLRLIGQDSAAVVQFTLSLKQNPNQVVPLSQIPPALIAMGRYEEARRMADSIIVVANAPPIMLWLRSVADSAIRTHAPPGSIRIGLTRR